MPILRACRLTLTLTLTPIPGPDPQDVLDAVAANAPVFFLHPRESFFPCTVEWFLQRAQLCVMRNVMLSRRVQRGVLRA